MVRHRTFQLFIIFKCFSKYILNSGFPVKEIKKKKRTSPKYFVMTIKCSIYLRKTETHICQNSVKNKKDKNVSINFILFCN